MLKVKEITFTNFTLFENNTIEFSDGINILIGKNSTGKSIVLKTLYSILSIIYEKNGEEKGDLEVYLKDKIMGVFLLSRVNRLVRRKKGNVNSNVCIIFSEENNNYEKEKKSFSFNLSSKTNSISIDKIFKAEIGNPIFIPTKEIISMMDRGLIGILETKVPIMEEIYLDLAKKLDKPVSLGRYDKETENLLRRFDIKELGKVSREKKEFYMYIKGLGRLESKLVAEGYRKLMTIIYLIKNGELTNGAFLFWDEPEANLNPTLVELVVDFLIFLIKNLKIQVFIATHDYFIIKYFDLKKKERKIDFPLKYISLYIEDKLLKIDFAEDLYMIKNNPIFEEFEKLYKLDVKISNE